MGKKKIDKEIFKALIEYYGIKDTDDIKDMLKDLMSGTIQTILETEIEHEPGYAKNSVSEKNTSNSRNGYSKKTVRSEYGNINLDIPKDRNAEFEPQMIRKLIYTTNPIEILNRQLRKYRLFVKSGGGKSSIILRDSKLNKLFKVVEFFYPVR